MVPLQLQYAATRVRTESPTVPSVSPPVLRDFSPVHSTMVGELELAGVTSTSCEVPVSSFCPSLFSNTIPIFNILKHSIGASEPEVLTIYDARYINTISSTMPAPFSIYHFDPLFSFIQDCDQRNLTPYFSKHDWRKFYLSLRLGRVSKAGFIRHTSAGPVFVEVSTDRAVFGRATEPAIGQAVNQSLWREATPPGGSSVLACQILDDTLAAHWDAHHLDEHFNRFRKLGLYNGLLEHSGKLVERAASVIFCGKFVCAKGISHLLHLWARSALRLVCRVHACNKKKHMQILLGNAQWLAGHSNLARPFLLPLYFILHFTRLRSIPTGYVSRSFYAALALATVPRNVSWGLSLVEFNPDNADLSAAHPLIYVDAAHDYGLACIAVITGDASSSYCVQISIPVAYTSTQQKAERWGLYWALGWCCRRGIVPRAVCADNMGAILADYSLSAPCADWLLVKLAQKISRLLFRHFPTLPMSHVQGALNPADLGTRQIFPFSIGSMFRAPDSVLSLHSLCVSTQGAFSNPGLLLKQKISSSSFPAGGPFWKQPPA